MILPGGFSEFPGRILVARTDALGDSILALPVCAAIKKNHPRTRVTFLVSPYTRELFENQPATDEVLVPADLRLWLRTAALEAALLLYPDLRISWDVFRACVPQRVGTGRRWWSFLYNRRVGHTRSRADRHEADYNLDLLRPWLPRVSLEPPRLRVLPAARQWAEKFLHVQGMNRRAPWVILHPGSRGSSANWSEGRYARLAGLLRKNHKIQVLLTGSAAESELLERVAGQSDPRPRVLKEAISLPQFAGLISQARVFVSGNTGPMHLAASLGVPTVSLFPRGGVTGPVRWRPLGNSSLIFSPPEDFSSGGRAAGQSLDSIPPEQVAAGIERSLRAKRVFRT